METKTFFVYHADHEPFVLQVTNHPSLPYRPCFEELVEDYLIDNYGSYIGFKWQDINNITERVTGYGFQ